MRTLAQIKACIFDVKDMISKLEGLSKEIAKMDFEVRREFTPEEMELVINSLEPKIVKRSVKKK